MQLGCSGTFELCQFWPLEGPIATDVPPYAMVMREALRLEGARDEMVWSEEKSHNTYEQALYSAQLLRLRGIHKIVLVGG